MTEPIPPVRPRELVLLARDFNRLVDWYVETFGFKVVNLLQGMGRDMEPPLSEEGDGSSVPGQFLKGHEDENPALARRIRDFHRLLGAVGREAFDADSAHGTGHATGPQTVGISLDHGTNPLGTTSTVGSDSPEIGLEGV